MAEIIFTACDPEILTPTDKPHLATLRWRIVEQGSDGPQRTDKHVHIGITIADAMKLLLLLQTLQTERGLRIAGEPTIAVVPPKHERN